MNTTRSAILLCVALAAGCGGGGSAGSGQSTSAAGADFGVPECDDYIKKVQECVDSKVPESSRALVRQTLDQSRDAWKKAAATPEGKAGLAIGCTQARSAARAAYAAYGCQF